MIPVPFGILLRAMNSKPQPPLLEIVIDSPQLADVAEKSGADRLELCSRMDLGGVTPDSGMMEQLRGSSRLPIHVMVRPRDGDFFYTPEEFELMKEHVRFAKILGMNGVVLGLLREDLSVDVERTAELVALADPLPVTFHRAYDRVTDMARALEDVIRSGAKRILTSGGAATAVSGAKAIGALIDQAKGRVTVMPGGGIHAKNISQVREITGATEIHTGLGSIIPYLQRDISVFEEQVRSMKRQLVSPAAAETNVEG